MQNESITITRKMHPNTLTVLGHLSRVDVKYIMLTGGTHSGKTHCALEALFLHCSAYEAGTTVETSRVLVSGKDLARLWDGMEDKIATIMATYPHIEKACKFNVQRKIFTFKTGWKVLFAATNNVGKVKNLDKCFAHFIDEIDNVPEPIWKMASDRATIMIGAWNPSVEFAIEQARRADRSGRTVFYTTNLMHTYEAGLLDEHRYRDLCATKEELGENHFWTQVYFYGRKGVVESRAFRDVSRCESFPKDCIKWCYGADYGYSPDPMAVVKVGLHEGAWYIQPLLYQTQIEPHNYAAVFNSIIDNRSKEIICDSAPLTFSQTLRSAGFYATPAKKGAGSIEDGVAKLAARKIYIVGYNREGDAAYKEFTTYARKANPLGGYFPDKFTPTFGDHAIDAARYALESLAIPQSNTQARLSRGVTLPRR